MALLGALLLVGLVVLSFGAASAGVDPSGVSDVATSDLSSDAAEEAQEDSDRFASSALGIPEDAALPPLPERRAAPPTVWLAREIPPPKT